MMKLHNFIQPALSTLRNLQAAVATLFRRSNARHQNPLTAPITIALSALALFACANSAWAVLPTPLPPTAAVSGDYIALFQEYWKKGAIVLGLIIGTMGFLSVAGGGIAKFNDFRSGKAELGDLSLYAVVGVIILVLMVYLLSTAADIL